MSYSPGSRCYRDRLLARLKTFLQTREQILAGPVYIAYSGGLDSTCLLHLLLELRQNARWFKLRALHINHHLNAHALAWQRHCQTFCAEHDVELTCCDVEVDTAHASLEAQARRVRYRALMQQTERNATIFLAHHRNDQFETILLRLMRGAGIKGMSAMAMIELRGGRTLARPLLATSRAEIEAYAVATDLSWVEDDSNADRQFDRNYLRTDIIPRLEQRWPEVIKVASESALIWQQQSSLLQQLALLDEHNIVRGGRLSLVEIKNLQPDRIQNFLQFFLAKNGERIPSKKWLEVLVSTLFALDDSAKFMQKAGSHSLCQGGRWLYLFRNSVLKGPDRDPSGWSFSKQAQCFELGNGWLLESKSSYVGGLNQSALKGIQLRYVALPKRIKLAHENFHRDTKKMCQERLIPSILRRHWPIFFHDDIPVAIPGIGVLNGYSTVENEPGVVFRCSLICHEGAEIEFVDKGFNLSDG